MNKLILKDETILTEEDFKQFDGKMEELFRMVFRVSSCAELRLGI